jgi:PTH1 family peptidyl-tRNA hydrolase
MYLVVGLGNPGEEYAATPHNAGFLVVDRLAEVHQIHVSRKDSKAFIGLGEIGGKAVMLAKPQTFMNLSGTSVAPLIEKHQIPVSNLVAVWDELNLPWGTVKVLGKGSAGGHNGAQSLIRSLGTQEFCRVRIGVHPGHPLENGADYLLSPVRRSLQKELDLAVEAAAEAVGAIITEGVEKAMTKFNRRAPGNQEEA